MVRSLETAKAHRVAVLYASRDLYARLLHEHLAAAGIAIDGPGTRPVLERAVARAVLELLTNEVPRADLFRVLSAAPMRTPDGERIPVDLRVRSTSTATRAEPVARRTCVCGPRGVGRAGDRVTR